MARWVGQSVTPALTAEKNFPFEIDRANFNLEGDRNTLIFSALNAQFWLNSSLDWTRLEDVTRADERYTKLAAFQSGQVFNNNAWVNEFGGNDYWQSGTINPHLVLSEKRENPASRTVARTSTHLLSAFKIMSLRKLAYPELTLNRLVMI